MEYEADWEMNIEKAKDDKCELGMVQELEAEGCSARGSVRDLRAPTEQRGESGRGKAVLAFAIQVLGRHEGLAFAIPSCRVPRYWI